MIPTIVYYLVPTIVILISVRKYRESKWGIGYEISKELCKRGALVVMACRDKQKALRAINKIQRELSTKNLVFMELNLASLSSIKAFADNFKSKFDKIDILVNNAGVSFDDSSNKVTEDGFEIHFGVNHLGHFLLTNFLLDKFISGSRIVIVSSLLHQKGNIDFGWVLTNLFRNHTRRMLMYFALIIPAAFLFMRSPKQGAQTPIFCATDPSIENESGCFYRDCRKFPSKVQTCDAISYELWSISEQMLSNKGISLNTL
ncbi:short chain dehydrogenase [Popillia japonica]|uniref:Short chain dehydrogenase n=1 Tax=Popillia japonica TaxID=7064 RepID=A0AAW1KJW3_POPJA